MLLLSTLISYGFLMTRTRFTLLALGSALSTLLLSGCNEDTSVSLGDPIPVAPTKSHGPACDTNADTQTIRFIHVADLHGHFGYREQFYSKIKQVHVDALAEDPFTLFTNGGDDYEKGTVAEQLSEGYATLEATQALEFDYRVIGNHDFAWGLSNYWRTQKMMYQQSLPPTPNTMVMTLRGLQG
ncbi:metallophosphoesterase [Vibrio variabilis]|uniref:metallophosphoesterase n=1 Tax=Vibrio variabilis TaxID=990271 RepID=UPI001EFA0B7B|nr:metallophosphoesterase [Vibrio variabilis]